ncbi:MAG TPA: thiolase family protein [Dehalococcoidia bacterium]|nr:thiolase family protein [Dehalococcoidia bacterium]
MAYDPKLLKTGSDVAAIVGIGETDFGADYAAARARKPPTTDVFGYAAKGFKLALEDAGLKASDIDGMVAALVPWMRVEEVLGLDLQFSWGAFWVHEAMALAIDAISSGRAECVAIIYGNAYRSSGRQFGGPNAVATDAVLHYYWYRPWGFTSQGAFDSVVVQRYMEKYGLKHEEIGMVPIAQRAWASMNPRAIMRNPITLEDYLRSPFVAAPLRLLDYCLINDGGVTLIVTSLDRARRLKKHPPVAVKGVGFGEDNADMAQFRPKLNFSRKQMSRAAQEAYQMAGVGPEEISAFYYYDNFSGELFYMLENCGYCEEGRTAEFIRTKGIGPGGKFPVNTSGGMLSEAYMHGWNAQVEMVRQLRGEAGPRQVEGARYAHFMLNQNAKAGSVIYGRMS